MTTLDAGVPDGCSRASRSRIQPSYSCVLPATYTDLFNPLIIYMVNSHHEIGYSDRASQHRLCDVQSIDNSFTC